MRARTAAVVLAAALLGLPGCRTCAQRRSEAMANLSQALLRLSSAAEGVVGYGDLPPGAGEKEILEAVAKGDPGLLAPFQGYSLHAQRQGKHAVLLVCEAGDRAGLLEDAGCSAPLEKALWAANPPEPCKFSLEASSICAAQVRVPPAP